MGVRDKPYQARRDASPALHERAPTMEWDGLPGGQDEMGPAWLTGHTGKVP